MAVRPLSMHLLQSPQPLARAARTGAAHGVESEQLKNARDQLAVKALADEDHGEGVAEIDSAGQNALMPEAEDFALRARAEGKRRYAFFGDDSKRHVRPTTHSSAHTTRGTTASTTRCRNVNLGLASVVTGLILRHRESAG